MKEEKLSKFEAGVLFNPLAPEFKIPAEPLMPEIKWRRPGDEQYRCVLRFLVLSYSRNGFSKDFIMYEDSW